MSSSVSSLSPGSLYQEIMAIYLASRRHGPLPSTGTHVHDDFVRSQPGQQDVTRLIIMLASVKLVAAKVKGGEDVVQGMSGAIATAIKGVFTMPGDDPWNSVPPGWHWPGPNPYLVAAELAQYSSQLTDKAAVAELNDIIGTFTTQIAQLTA